VRLIRNETRAGRVAARNIGLRAARGDFVAFQESADEWIPGRLEQQMAVFAADRQEVVLVGGMLARHYRAERRFVPHHWVGGDLKATVSAIDRRRFVDGFQAFLETALIRRSALERAGAFDESLDEMHDFELCLRLLEQGEFRALPTVVSLSRAERDPFADTIARRASAMRAILEKYGALYGRSGDVMFRDWYGIAYKRLKSGDAVASARAAREAARYRPTDPRPWIVWGLMKAVPLLGPWTVRAVHGTRALLRV